MPICEEKFAILKELVIIANLNKLFEIWVVDMIMTKAVRLRYLFISKFLEYKFQYGASNLICQLKNGGIITQNNPSLKNFHSK